MNTDHTADPRRPWAAAPILLGPNQPARRPYLGGAGIAAFRGTPWTGADPHTPEDFVGSTTSVHGSATVGLTVLEPGLTLKEAVAADPEGFLGPDHVAAFGADPMLLVKLLDTGERLFVHLHPSDDFAGAHLGERRGKTEAWAIVAVAEGVDAYAAVGFTREVSTEEATAWFDGQDVDGMLAAMHRVPLSVGSTLLVPAGVPHAIGPGITLVELQQPTDLSILLEHQGYGDLTVEDATLGLDLPTALGALDRRRWDPRDVEALAVEPRPVRPSTVQLFPSAADRFFRAERITVAGVVPLDAAYSIVIVLDGALRITHREGIVDVTAGDTVLVPFGIGPVELDGAGTIIRALPPTP